MNTVQKLFQCGLIPNSLNFALSRLPSFPAGRPGSRSWLQGPHALAAVRASLWFQAWARARPQWSTILCGPCSGFSSLALRSYHEPSHRWVLHSRTHCHCGCCVRWCLEQGALSISREIDGLGRNPSAFSCRSVTQVPGRWLKGFAHLSQAASQNSGISHSVPVTSVSPPF